MKRARFIVLVAALFLGGCASMRGVQVGTEPNRTFAIEVTNNRAGTVTVSYTGNGVGGELGTVAPRMTERFVIAMADPGQITVVAKTTSGASAGNYQVTLEAGVTKRVTVR
jgi:uncharacterized lipoprotein YajG